MLDSSLSMRICLSFYHSSGSHGSSFSSSLIQTTPPVHPSPTSKKICLSLGNAAAKLRVYRQHPGRCACSRVCIAWHQTCVPAISSSLRLEGARNENKTPALHPASLAVLTAVKPPPHFFFSLSAPPLHDLTPHTLDGNHQLQWLTFPSAEAEAECSTPNDTVPIGKSHVANPVVIWIEPPQKSSAPAG